MKSYERIDGCDILEIAQNYPTPAYILSWEGIYEKAQQFKEHFLDKYENVDVYYASKAFLCKGMCKIIDKFGFGLDVVSGGEIYTAYKSGFPMERVMFHGNNKSLEEISDALLLGVGRVVVDNDVELENLIDLSEKLERKIKVLLRVSPHLESKDIDTHHFITTGQVDTKFGFLLEKSNLKLTIQKVLKSNFLEFVGLHSHIGSQIQNYQIYEKCAVVMSALVCELSREMNFEIQELNMGGGYGIVYDAPTLTKRVDFFLNPMMQKLDEEFRKYKVKRPKIIIEPGRFLIAEAGHTIYRIGANKDIKEIRKFLFIDGGMADNMRVALYQARYSASVIHPKEEREREFVTIAGRFCETGDILIKDIELERAEIGDILMIHSTGAYNFSMFSHYNRFRRPPVLLLKEGKVIEMVKAESYEELIALDCDIEI